MPKVNVEFPQHFFDFTTGVYITDENINEWIQECIAELERHPDWTSSLRASGDTRVTVERGDEECDMYEIYVSRGYYHAIVDRHGKPVFNEEANTQCTT